MNRITAQNAPAAIGPYSHAIQTGNLIFCSGQLGIDPTTGRLCSDSVTEQTIQIFRNIKAVLEAAGIMLNDVAKTTVFITSMSDFQAMNQIYASSFGEHKPARSTVQVNALPLGAKVEIECVAIKEE